MSSLKLTQRLFSSNGLNPLNLYCHHKIYTTATTAATIPISSPSYIHHSGVNSNENHPQRILTRKYSTIFHRNINNLATLKPPLNTRFISSQQITKNLQLFSESPRCNAKDAQSLRLNTPLDKPLVVLLSWLMSKQKHLKKYAQLYTDQGFDVLTVQVTPWQFMWPKQGAQLVAADVVKFLENNVNNNPLLLHGFSVGGYVWGECMVLMARDTERFKHVINCFNGQIWDSVVDISEIHIGVPKAMFPKNYTLQKAATNYMLYHMKTFHENATSHYLLSSELFYSTLVKKPALFFLSHSDPIGAVSSNLQLRAKWEALGINCDWKCWEKSPHVGHFLKHREEYVHSLTDFLQTINMVQYPDKMRLRALV